MTDDELRQVRHEIEAWALRPPARSPGAARARIGARIGKRRPRGLWQLAGAVVVVAIGTVGLLLDRGAPEPTAAPAARAPQSQRLLVYELESGTRIYYAFPAARLQDTGLLR